MRPFSLSLSLSLVLLALAACRDVRSGAMSRLGEFYGCVSGIGAEPTGPVVARVGDVPITASEFKSRATQFGRQALAVDAAGRRRALDSIIEAKIIAIAARKAGLERDPAVRLRLDEQRELLLGAIFIERLQSRAAVSEQEIQAYYAAHPEFFSAEAFLASRIVVRTPEAARRVQAGLRSKKPFGTLARLYSTDKASARNGGKIGPLPLKTLKPAYAEALPAMKDGEIAGPLRTAEGYEILRRDRKVLEPRPLDDVRDTIRGIIATQKMRQPIAELKASLPIEVDARVLNSVDLSTSTPSRR